jgi:hypothetical protein
MSLSRSLTGLPDVKGSDKQKFSGFRSPATSPHVAAGHHLWHQMLVPMLAKLVNMMHLSQAKSSQSLLCQAADSLAAYKLSYPQLIFWRLVVLCMQNGWVGKKIMMSISYHNTQLSC